MGSDHHLGLLLDDKFNCKHYAEQNNNKLVLFIIYKNCENLFHNFIMLM